MRYAAVILIAGFVVFQAALTEGTEAVTNAAKAATDAATDAATSAASTGTAAVTDAATAGTGAVTDTVKNAMDTIKDPSAIMSQAQNALNPSQITGMITPFSNMARDLINTNVDAAEAGVQGSLSVLQDGMRTMSESVKKTPIIGTVASPMLDIGNKLFGLPGGLFGGLFGATRQISNAATGALGANSNTYENKNRFNPALSDKNLFNFGSFLSPISSMIPKTPLTGATQ